MEELHQEVVCSDLGAVHYLDQYCLRLATNTRRNRAELAEGWYEPSTLDKAVVTVPTVARITTALDSGQPHAQTTDGAARKHWNASDSDSDDVGPLPPLYTPLGNRGAARAGPATPSLQDLELRKGNPHVSSLAFRAELADTRIRAC